MLRYLEVVNCVSQRQKWNCSSHAIGTHNDRRGCLWKLLTGSSTCVVCFFFLCVSIVSLKSHHMIFSVMCAGFYEIMWYILLFIYVSCQGCLVNCISFFNAILFDMPKCDYGRHSRPRSGTGTQPKLSKKTRNNSPWTSKSL